MGQQPVDLKLLPCPFCGAEAGFDGGWVFCHQCGVGYGDRDNAVLRKLWNRRWYAAGSRFGKTASRAVDVDAILKVAEEMDSMTDCDVWKKPYIAANAWAAALRKSCGK